MSERRGWYLPKAALKALYDEHWPRNLRLELHAYVPAKVTVPLNVLTPSRLQWNPARTLTPFQKKLIKF